MITDRNKLNFVTIQWLWFLCLILACSSGTWIHNVEAATQQQQQQQQTLLQQQPQQMKSTLQQQQHQEFESNGPPQHQQQQQQQQQLQDVTVRNFSPRMDYNNNEWRPVGRGDPLKNDPTFDYSPPTLDRVRYWADPDKEKEKMEEVTAALVEAKLKKANPGKNEILLLGVTGDRERIRGAAPPVVPHVHQPSASVVKNAKGETPLLQPKYTSIRRSYYAHQIPTHLMPPPMQPAATQQLQSTSHMVKQPAHTEYQQQQQQQQQLQSGSHMVKQPAHTEYQPQQQQQMHSGAHMVKPAHTEYQQQMHSGSHMVKPVHTEYRHNMPAHSYMTSSPMSSMNMHSKPYYMSTATQSWLHNPSSSQPVSSSIHSGMMMSGNSQRYSHPHDSHHQESVNYFSYNTRPHMTSSTPSLMMMNGAGSHHDVYSPNSIRGSSGLHKSATSSRKPWIHDLLQKEFIKPVKPTMGPHTYHSETIKPLHTESHFEPMLGSQGTSTTYTPVTFVTPTMPTTTTPNTQAVYITSTTYQTTTPSTTTTTTNAPSSIYPSYSTQVPRTTSTFSPTRLLIPNTSNLSFRPTVAPMKMTTDSLFSHYNQPDKPLRGPMYLIIEGHSKVKTYGKDELDPHKPKIVPVIPKREPVLRIADPNEKRGTPETFQVKHLHTKTTPIMKTTTTTTTARTTTSTPRTTTKPTTTKKPLMKTTTTKSTTTVKPTTNTKTTQKMLQKMGTTKSTTTTTTSTTTSKPLTTKMTPKLSVTTSSKPKVEKIPTNNEKISIKDSKSSNKGEKSTMDLKMSSKLNTNNPNSLETPQKKPSQTILNDPPTGMQGLMSFLDSSLGNMFKEDPLAATALEPEKKETTTKLKAIPMNTATQKSAPQTEARVSTKLEAIKAEDYHDDDDKFFKVTTEYLPRETRQIFDYDQLPESRINDNDNSNYDDLFEDDLSAFNFDTEYEEDDEEDQQGATVENQQNLIKRIDSLVSSSTEDDFDDSSAFDDVDLTDIGEEDLEALAESRQQHQSKKA